jgi:hypothetical protein
LDASLRQPDSGASDFLDRPADERRHNSFLILGCVFGGVAVFARWRMAAIIAKASMTSEVVPDHQTRG